MELYYFLIAKTYKGEDKKMVAIKKYKNVDKELAKVKRAVGKERLKMVGRMRDNMPLDVLSVKERDFIYSYTGNVRRTVSKVWGVIGTEALMKTAQLMKDPTLRRCVEVMDEMFETYGLLSAYELRRLLVDIAEDDSVLPSTKISAIKLLMTDKEMIGKDKQPAIQNTYNAPVIISKNPMGILDVMRVNKDRQVKQLPPITGEYNETGCLIDEDGIIVYEEDVT